jgi:DNA-binding GntR family transcriptional regulator
MAAGPGITSTLIDQPRGSMANMAYDTIKRAIIRCDLDPGQSVSEAYLAQRFGLSRAVVRPALKRLFQEQFVQMAGGQRYVIPPITLKDVLNVFELRILLEPAAARQAAGRISAEDLDHLRDLCAVQYRPGDRESAETFLKSNTEFHVTVARAAGNDLLTEVIQNLLDREERFNHLSHMLNDRNAAALHEHSELVEALVAGDGDRAERVMAAGIESARTFVVEALLASPSIQTAHVTRPLDAPRLNQ